MYEVLTNPIEQEGQRVLTTAQLAEYYETDSRIISNNFNRNRDRFIEGKHFYRLTGEALKEFKTNHQIDESSIRINILYLWTERGALLHAKSLNTDKAWEVHDFLIDTYFRVQELKTSYTDTLLKMYQEQNERYNELLSRMEKLESKQTKTKKPLLTDADEKLKSEIEKFLDIPITEDWYYTSLEERKKYIKDYQNGTAIAGTYKRDHISVKEIACELLGYDLNQTVSRRMSLKIARILIAIGWNRTGIGRRIAPHGYVKIYTR